MAVELAFLGAPACGVKGGDDAENPVRREKAVVDSRRETIGEDRLAEVLVRIDIVRAPRRSRHADLGRWLKVFKNVTPAGLVSRTSPVTLVHDDQVEVVRRILAVEARPDLILRDRLVQGEVDFPALLRLTLDLPDGIAEDRELARDRLVHEECSGRRGRGSDAFGRSSRASRRSERP